MLNNEGNDKEWFRTFNELCYEVFYKNPVGARLLLHLENKFFRSPVAYPNREPAWAFLNEGRNELIRSFTAGMQAYIATTQAQAKAKKDLSEAAPSIGRTRKAATRPIR